MTWMCCNYLYWKFFITMGIASNQVFKWLNMIGRLERLCIFNTICRFQLPMVWQMSECAEVIVSCFKASRHCIVFVLKSVGCPAMPHIYIYIYIYNHQSCISATVRKSIWLVRQFDDISYITKYVQVTWLSITIIGSNYCLNSHLYRNMPHSSQNLLA